MQTKLFLILAMILVILSGCDKRPEGVLSDKEMVQLMTDMEVAEVYIQNNSNEMYNDSSRDKTIQYIIEKRGIDKAQFDSTMTWYGRNIDIYQELYKKVDAELAKRQKNAIGGDAMATVQQGSDLWPYSRHLIMSEMAQNNSLNFSFVSEQIEKGDKLNFKLRANGLDYSSAMLGVDYENGLSTYSYSTQNATDKIDISLQLDTFLTVKRIFGYVRPKNKLKRTVWLDSIALERVPYDSTQYYRIFSQRKVYAPKKREPVKIDTVEVDEQDANLQKILTDDGGLNMKEEKSLRTNPNVHHAPSMMSTPTVRNKNLQKR
ncbi:MAG: DUF4296 domain-containing protein [Muribaculaceae bacterium]|nr:DUF4296 domain-containing protein [Muribaculaceae bacterium]